MLPAPNNARIEQAILDAQEMWHEWLDVFEHAGPPSVNPILADPNRFRYFCDSWSVARTLRAGTSDEFRCTLRDSQGFTAALEDHTGVALDQLHKDELRMRFGTRDGKRGVQSALSKVATFVQPEWFTAYDYYASSGLNLIIGRSKSAFFPSYASYLADFNAAWNGPHGERIREIIKPVTSVQAEPRFQRRVLDLYLMVEGGYVE